MDRDVADLVTLLGWLVENGIWEDVVDTGLCAMAMAVEVVGIGRKGREEEGDEGKKGML